MVAVFTVPFTTVMDVEIGGYIYSSFITVMKVDIGCCIYISSYNDNERPNCLLNLQFLL